MRCAYYFHLTGVYGLIREALPHHKVDKMGGHICDTLALTAYVVVPCRAPERHSVDFLVEMVDAFHHYAGILRAAAAKSTILECLASCDIDFVVTLSHEIQNYETLSGSQPVGFAESGHVGRVQRHGLV